MKIFTKVPLNLKLFFSGIVPVLALLYFFFLIYQQKQEQIAETEDFQRQVMLSTNVNKLLENLRQERRESLSKLAGKETNEDLNNERAEVDSNVEEIKQILDSDAFTNYQSLVFFNRLPEWRTQIDNNQLNAVSIVNNYQMMLDRLLPYSYTQSGRLTSKVGELSQTNTILANLVNYISLMRLQVYFRGLDNDYFQQEFIYSFPINYKLYKSYEYELLNSKNEDLVRNYVELSQEGGLKPTLDYFDSLYNDSVDELHYTADDWWKVSAEGMDELLKLNENLLYSIQDEVVLIYKQDVQDKNLLIAILLLINLLIIVFKYAILKTIGEQLSTLKRAAQKMAKGITDIKLPIFPRDAMGSLARSFIQIDRNNKKVAFAASQIGKNIFDTPFELRGDQDELGHAILHMRDSLKTLSEHNENEIWIQTGLSTINNVLLSDRSLHQISKAALKNMIKYLGAEVGTLYLVSQDKYLKLQSTYATINIDQVPKTIALGETRLGEAAVAKKPLFITHVPEDYLSIGSSVGKAQPTSLLILPLVQNNELEGVMEIASFSPFHPVAERFVQQVSSNIASAIHSIQSKLQLQELLEEVQAQSEELQSKHSELESLNTELEAQAQKLQASEEELKVQQEELMQSNQELEERSNLLEERNQIIIERNLEIQKKAEELELSTRYKSEFLANMSHELRTPLNSILLLSRLLSENAEKRLSEEQVEFAEVILTSGNNLLTLIDEILDLSKIEAGKMEMDFQTEALPDIIATLRSVFTPMAADKMLDLSFHINEDVPHQLITDRLRLEQILKNLLSNALKFTKKGFVSVKVETDPQNRNWLFFKVKDSGIGIPKDKREHVFGAFQQADGSTRRKFGGTGLGLSISLELAKLLGGTLKINDEVTEGSEFILRIPVNADKRIEEVLPVKEPKPAAVPIPLETTENTVQESQFLTPNIPEDVPDDRNNIETGDKIILIIEDDTGFAKALMTFSRKKGYKCLVAVRGDKGIELANQFQPQGILLDLELPIKDGWQVMRELKSNAATRHIPVHMMSSYERKHESLLKGAIDFISKPVDFEQMTQIFNKLDSVFNKDSRKVLIVEENIKHAKALAYYLESFNVKVKIKEGIEESIDALSNDEIDCVILDMGIPDTIAFETLEAIKDRPGLEGLPIIIFTGKNLSQIEEQKIKQYASSIVVKTAHSYERILDEIALFLHIVEQNTTLADQSQKKHLNKFTETLKGKTVLIADDDVRNIFSLTKALENHGMDVLTASDGKEALKTLEEHSETVDIVLLDMMMPEMDGYETLSRIRKDPKLKHLPILAVTAKAMMGDREKCIAAGASDYISKPVDTNQLISLLRVWLYH